VPPVLEVSGLSKRFGAFAAVDGLSFSLEEGEVLGLLGPNGAGKTTSINMLLGLTIPDAGVISYFGRAFPREREYCLSRLNMASAYSKVQGRLSVRQNLEVYAGLYGVRPEERIAELAALLRMERHLDTPYRNLSSGERTRVHLMKALLNSPSVLLLDEPTASLDPDIRNEVLDLIRELQHSQKVSILYTSHDMEEVMRICDRVLFLSHGKLVASGTPLELAKQVRDARLRVTFDGKDAEATKYLTGKKLPFRFPRAHVVEVELPEEQIPGVLFGLAERGLWLTRIEVEKPHLEDVFLAIARRGR